jgi:hypothetical protein
VHKDPSFDQRIDKLTKITTNSIFSVPIYKNKVKIACGTEMIDLIDSSTFNEDDNYL